MKTSLKFSLTCISLATLVACGGGGGGGGGAGGGGATTLAPSPSASPSATLANSETAANEAIAEANAGLAAAENGATGAGFDSPLGVVSGALPTGVTGASISCSTFGAGGSGTIDYDVSGLTGGLVSGASISYVYNNCSFSGYTYNGTFRLTYDRYTSPTDFAYTASYQNFTVSGNGLSNYAFSGAQSCDYVNSAITCYYSDGTRGWSSSFTYSAGRANGTYSVNYGSGTVRVSYTNYGATSGTARITGANGAYYEVQRCGAAAYTVRYSANGNSTTSTYNVGGGCNT